jgi:hypothetical protein
MGTILMVPSLASQFFSFDPKQGPLFLQTATLSARALVSAILLPFCRDPKFVFFVVHASHFSYSRLD